MAAKSPMPAKPGLYDLQLVPVDKIVDDGANPRIQSPADKVKFEFLVRSMTRNGLLQPIMIFYDGGKAHIIFGNRRTAVARHIDWKKIPALIYPKIPDAITRDRLRATENIDRDDLNPAEQSKLVVEMLKACGGDVAMAAEELGRDERWARDNKYLERLTGKVRDMLADGRVSFTQAREIVKWPGTSDQVRIAMRILSEQSGGPTVTIEEIRNWHEEEKQSLKSVSWSLDVAFASKPACSTCEHNTANNLTLFGITKKSDTEPACTFKACYDVKVEKCAAEQRKESEKLKARVARNEISAESALSLDVAKEVSPPFVKPEAMQSTIKGTIPPTPLSPAVGRLAGGSSNGAADRTEKPPEKKPLSEKDIRQAALITWANEFRRWRGDLCSGIVAAADADKELRICRLILEHADPFIKHDGYWAPHSAYDFVGNHFKTASPAMEDAPGPLLARLLTCISKRNLEQMADAISFTAEPERLSNLQCGPQLCLSIANAFGAPTSPPPVFERFLPRELQPAAFQDKPPAGSSAGAPKHTEVFPPGTEKDVELKFDKNGWLSVVRMQGASIDVSVSPADGGFMASALGTFGHGAATARFEIHDMNERTVYESKAAAVLAACQSAGNWLMSEVVKTHKKDMARIDQVMDKLRGFSNLLMGAAGVQGGAR